MDNCDIIIDRNDLNIRDTLECGQVFRYVNLGNHYALKASDKECVLYYNGANTVIESNDKAYFENYFDLANDYSSIKTALAPLPFMSESIPYGSGIRILRQDPWETIISFIISANNHIPRIKKIIERISNNLAFPTPSQLANYTVDDLRIMGLGFRDKYIHYTANKINNREFDINACYGMDSIAASKCLQTLMGVGAKVADCILLFGYHRSDVFPVDTWVKKIFNSKFGEEENPKIIRAKLVETYGDLSGYAQQYLFYAARREALK